MRSHERLPQEEGLGQEPLDPTLIATRRHSEPELFESLRLPVDQRLDAKLLGEASQLPARWGAFRKIDEVDLPATLGEEAQGLSSLGALLGSEDLYVHEEIVAGGGTPPGSPSAKPPGLDYTPAGMARDRKAVSWPRARPGRVEDESEKPAQLSRQLVPDAEITEGMSP